MDRNRMHSCCFNHLFLKPEYSWRTGSMLHLLQTWFLASPRHQQQQYPLCKTNRSSSSQAHYDDVIMGARASQIISLTIVYSTVYSDADQRKHQGSASLAFVWGIHRGPVNYPYKWPFIRGKCFHLMTSSWSISNSSKWGHDRKCKYISIYLNVCSNKSST